MDPIEQNERDAIHNFFVQVTLPIIAAVEDQFCIIGTGTLFKVGGFFVNYRNPINELTNENVSNVNIRGTSGCSIWAYRKRGWVDHSVWSPEACLCVVGVQSAFVMNDYLRAKSWGLVIGALGSLDEHLRSELTETVNKIRKALGR